LLRLHRQVVYETCKTKNRFYIQARPGEQDFLGQQELLESGVDLCTNGDLIAVRMKAHSFAISLAKLKPSAMNISQPSFFVENLRINIPHYLLLPHTTPLFSAP
jgi:hypothetical protein